METVYSCLAGIDVHKKMLAVVVRREQNGKAEYESRKFGTTEREIRALAAWLQERQVREVVMESTALYWWPVWRGLEPHFTLHLCNPLQVRAVQGRKRDFKDATRLADRWSAGDLNESFVPNAEQRGWRSLTRMRVDLKDKIGMVRNQVEGLLERGGIKLTSVVSDPFGVSGWAMLKLIAAGETSVSALAAQARGKLRRKADQLEEALAGKLDATLRLLLRQYMEQVELLRRHITQLEVALAEAMKGQVVVLHRLMQVPGVDLCAAQELVAEIGSTAAAFPSASQFASWVGVCPGSKESAGICYSNRSAKGNRYLRRLLCQIAWASVRTRGTFFAGFFQRLRLRNGNKSAVWAVAHRIAKLIWMLLHDKVDYQEKGPTPLNPKTLVRKLKRLIEQFDLLNMDIKPLLGMSPAAPA